MQKMIPIISPGKNRDNTRRMIDPTVYVYGILPVSIFCARIFDVSLGTIRIIFVSRGFKLLAPIFGFVEISIWLFAISAVFSLNSPPTVFFAYALGFACGNYVGIWIEEKMAMGISIIRIITQFPADRLIDDFKALGYRTTVIDAMGQRGEVNLIFTVVKRKEIPDVLERIQKWNPHAFYTVEDVKRASDDFTFYSDQRIKQIRGMRKKK